ncbi:MAG: hypothetical protein ACD_65C00007G0001 [uncultured bacterium]|nr:MAG: hypothetical protein ACD_65C00007G0001 [uncultured bacterium]KKT01507.1 MAG: hypothetical protein UV80_C0013G0004 [Candidatus Peregrinibacteria bacterium GW2011_GWF2_43_17]HAU40374.1 hypothetical protein [Candidatus Peregrinibacteria bacterium]
MSKTIENINKISFPFFAVLGITHILSMLMLANNYVPTIAEIIYKTLDLPFLLSALIYGSSAFQLGLYKIRLHSRILTIILVILSSMIFMTAIYLNFFTT